MMWKVYQRSVSALVMTLAGVSALGVLLMMIITCVDIIMRRLGHPLPGVVDIVSIAGSGTQIEIIIPQTDAIKDEEFEKMINNSY